MPDDLPEISQDPNAPLPQVDPNSQLVPYRMERTDPGQAPVVTTGYGQRARPPIQPPAEFGSGVGMPNLDQIYQAAFSKLPVDEAIKAVEAATRFQAQRGYQQDLQSGKSAAEAFAKWGPMLFRQATGVPEAIERSVPPPITPQQLIQNRLNQAKFDAAQKAAQAKTQEGDLRTVGGVLYRVKPGTPPEALTKAPPPKPEKPAVTEEERDAYKELDEARKDITKLAGDNSKKGAKALQDAQFRMRDATQRIAALKAPSQPATPPNPAQATATPATTQPTVLPFPKSKKEAVKDAVYATKNGPMKWDGEHFVPLQ